MNRPKAREGETTGPQRLRRGPVAWLFTHPLLGMSVLAPPFLLSFVLVVSDGTASAVGALVVLVAWLPSLATRTVVEDGFLDLRSFGVLLARVDLRRSRGVRRYRDLNTGRGSLFENGIQVIEADVVYARSWYRWSFGLWTSHCLGKRRRQQWLEVLGAPTKGGIALPSLREDQRDVRWR